jgi:hypothetical protein
MLFSSLALRPRRVRAARCPCRCGDSLHVAAQGGDEMLAVARQRGVLAVHYVGLERCRFDDVERPEFRPLVAGHRELVDDRNAQAVRHESAHGRAEAGADRHFVTQRMGAIDIDRWPSYVRFVPETDFGPETTRRIASCPRSISSRRLPLEAGASVQPSFPSQQAVRMLGSVTRMSPG